MASWLLSAAPPLPLPALHPSSTSPLLPLPASLPCPSPPHNPCRAPPLELVRAAVTARSALEASDLEALETLGDAFLKFAVSTVCVYEAESVGMVVVPLRQRAQGTKPRMPRMLSTTLSSSGCATCQLSHPALSSLPAACLPARLPAGVCPAVQRPPAVPRGPADQAQGAGRGKYPPGRGSCQGGPPSIPSTRLVRGADLPVTLPLLVACCMLPLALRAACCMLPPAVQLLCSPHCCNAALGGCMVLFYPLTAAAGPGPSPAGAALQHAQLGNPRGCQGEPGLEPERG